MSTSSTPGTPSVFRSGFSNGTRRSVADFFNGRCVLCMNIFTFADVAHILHTSSTIGAGEVRFGERFGILPSNPSYNRSSLNNAIYLCPSCHRRLSKLHGLSYSLVFFVPCRYLLQAVSVYRGTHPDSQETFDQILDHIHSNPANFGNLGRTVTAFYGLFELYPALDRPDGVLDTEGIPTPHLPQPQMIHNQQCVVFDARALSAAASVRPGYIALYTRPSQPLMLWRLHRSSGAFLTSAGPYFQQIIVDQSELAICVRDVLSWAYSHSSYSAHSLLLVQGQPNVHSEDQAMHLDHSETYSEYLETSGASVEENTLVAEEADGISPQHIEPGDLPARPPIPESTPRMTKKEDRNKWLFGPEISAKHASYLIYGGDYQSDPWDYRP
ncbi:hypothetical protein K488DRAFT_72213 [Vararia minispora EC-137]|uniref:Uncharacterized protein n=1 Tax=Vararia minispora EC-137 TaxID=1314806 RepID=A0ACB8QF33_9AGAM|nr:hypothetical protein K488DRAFT_72213 [Vararia minispora EC-137]